MREAASTNVLHLLSLTRVEHPSQSTVGIVKQGLRHSWQLQLSLQATSLQGPQFQTVLSGTR